jgi:hypothetical protein
LHAAAAALAALLGIAGDSAAADAPAPDPSAAVVAPPVVLDDMSAPQLWHAVGSDGVAASIEPAADGAPAISLRFDFQRHAGYAVAERALSWDPPENFEIDVDLSGTVPPNRLEIKFIDASGDNVWWYRRADLSIQGQTQHLRIRRREIQFAWGPTADHRLPRIERLQFVVGAGSGGAGALTIGSIRLTPKPPPPSVWPAPTARAAGAAVAVPDGTTASAWHCRPTAGTACELTVDWRTAREFGGLRLDWDPDRRASAYELSTSADAADWHVERRVAAGGGSSDRLWLPDSEARYLRLRITAARGDEIVLRSLQLEDPAFGRSRNALIESAASEAPRGFFPRGFLEQSYWTLVGVDGGPQSGLLSEDGALETNRGGPSLEPFVVENDRVFDWAGVELQRSLLEGYLPMPRVLWTSDDWTLEIGATALSGTAAGLDGRYRLHNRTQQRLRLRLLLALRPFQVNPPAQFLTTPGGVAPIEKLSWNGHSLLANDATEIMPLAAPSGIALFPFEANAVPGALAAADWQRTAESLALADESGLASGVLAYDVDLAPDASETIAVRIPWDRAAAAHPAPSLAALDAAQASLRAQWHTKLNRVRIEAPDSADARDLANALRTAEAHILISRDGPMLRPGTRAYARSWIRDGAMMSSALLRLGETRVPQEYLRWYSRYLFADGKVPCCVDERGADPVPEHDSAGEFLFLAAEIYRRGGDRALVAGLWPKLHAAVDYLESLRQSTRRTATPFFGLLPPSISHEGYSTKPMHSLWDDFWALRGYSDAAYLARALGRIRDAERIEAERASFATELAAALVAVTREKKIDFIPGAVDLGDFDATSTTIVLAPGVGPLALPHGLLENTFERYWQQFVARRDGTLAWNDYTPYEWRIVGTFVRLGWRDRADAALQYFMADRRPIEWNQWPEVIGRSPREARFIGDLPHGWVASDFIRSALDLFAYELPAEQSTVLAAGVPLSWLDGRGLSVQGLRTDFGVVSYTLRHRKGALELRLPPGLRVPLGGFVFRVPGAAPSGIALVDGNPVPFAAGALTLRSVPARVVIRDNQ